MATKDVKKAGVASKKRQKILSSKHTMFLWVAGMSAVVGVCIVVGWLLIKQVIFTDKVLDEKHATITTLEANNEALPELKENIRLQETNQDLQNNKATENEAALQVVLDALPAQPNSLALGSSIQDILLGPVDGLTIESLSVEPVEPGLVQPGEVGTMPFTMEVTATSIKPIEEMLNRLERSIRIIDIDSMTMTVTKDRYTVSINAHAYYAEQKTVELDQKVVKP